MDIEREYIIVMVLSYVRYHIDIHRRTKYRYVTISIFRVDTFYIASKRKMKECRGKRVRYDMITGIEVRFFIYNISKLRYDIQH